VCGLLSRPYKDLPADGLNHSAAQNTEQYALLQGNTPQKKHQQISTTPGPLPNPDEASLQVHSQLQSSLLNSVHRVSTDRVSNKKYHIPDEEVRKKIRNCLGQQEQLKQQRQQVGLWQSSRGLGRVKKIVHNAGAGLG
jgi:hypothetical protein